MALKDIGEIQKSLKRIPAIELSTPSVVLVGAPNVGKSSIVRAVSSGTPEVRERLGFIGGFLGFIGGLLRNCWVLLEDC